MSGAGDEAVAAGEAEMEAGAEDGKELKAREKEVADSNCRRANREREVRDRWMKLRWQDRCKISWRRSRDIK